MFVPAAEVDPETGDAITEIVEVGSTGVIETWTWVDPPRPGSPWEEPHGLALVRLDGADTPMLHGVLVESADDMATGMRVEAVWRSERVGHIPDLMGFVPEGTGQEKNGVEGAESTAEGTDETVRSIRTPMRLEYDFFPQPRGPGVPDAYADKRFPGESITS
ncbi:MAG: hypothetical protein CM1200mP26_27260 [Acidimicrobiales bacterium]|nr:MAG: hypothetical protein CM1200mP26_27260 [Acidimicrobiales bacterium]